MDLHQLRIFVTVAREGNLTRAAEKLFLSQPAVSGQIKALEEELGLCLFKRVPRGMLLTPAGEELMEEADFALNAAGKVKARAQYLKRGVYGECRLGTVTEPGILRIGEFMAFMIGQYPDLRVSLSQGISGEIAERLLRGEIDAGYVIGTIDDERIESLEIAPVTLKIAGPIAWADKLRDAEWDDLAKFPWISTPPKCSFHRIASEMFERNAVKPRTIIEADLESTLSRLVASEVGLTLLREDVARVAENNGEVYIWGKGQESTKLNLIYLKEERESAKIIAVLDAVRAVWQLPPQHPSR